MFPTNSVEKASELSHIPEMVFGNNSLSLKHLESGFHIELNATDALSACRKGKGACDIQVKHASEWQKKYVWLVFY